MTEPSYEPKSARQVAGEISFVQRAAKSILSLHDRDGKLPEGVDQEQIDALAALADQDVLPAKAAALGTMTGLVPAEALYMLYAKSRNALHLLGSIALMRLADKMDDRRAPGDTKVLLKVVEWAGLPTPNLEPKDDAGRLEQMQQADMGALTDEDLHKQLMERLRRS